MKIKRIELKKFKRFTHLIVENIPETTKLVVLVGPNGSGKTSFMEAMNHFHKFAGYGNTGDYRYLSKVGDADTIDHNNWYNTASNLVNIEFYNMTVPNIVGSNENVRGHFYFRSAYRNEPDFHIDSMRKQQNPIETIRLESLIL